MKKFTYAAIVVAAFILMLGSTMQAQITVDFQNRSVGDTVKGIGWGPTDDLSTVVNDSIASLIASGNKALKNTIKNYNAAPVIAFTLPAGKTLANYGTLTFKGLFAQGDVGYKDIVVEAYQAMPTAQFANVAANKIGAWSRSKMGSTGWEDISVNIINTSTFSGTVYLAVGINCAGTGNVGGTGVPTIWYADNLTLVPYVDPSITKWGKTNLGNQGALINSTTPGNAGLTNPQGRASNTWGTIRGSFDTLTATTSQAVVVSGQMELVGGGGANAYTWMRYALTFQDSSTLNYPGTDTAVWVSTLKHYGYEFDPISGSGTMSNTYNSWPEGNQGTAWLLNNGNWTSTNSNGGGPFSAVKNAPRNAVANAGTYNWAISVQPINDTINEVRWYLVEQANKYWFGGTARAKATTKKFNGLAFGFNNDMQATQINFKGVKAQLGTPITVPEAPWQAFYVDQWGKTNLGKEGKILWQDTTGGKTGTIIGDAGLTNPQGRASNTWGTIRGAFGDPVTATTSKALIVSGQLELVGGGGANAYTWMRYALTYEDSVTLKYRGTDTAAWYHSRADSITPLKHYGYEFDPISGSGTMSNTYNSWPEGNQGTAWLLNNGNWTSTNSNGGGPFSAVKNAPRNAVANAGIYNWAISVQPINDTINEVRWYLVEQANKYWFGGTARAKATTKKFNGIAFGFNNDMQATQINLMAVKVDMGTAITIPEAPWQAFYVDQWGKTNLGKEGKILWQDTTGGKTGTIIGDAGLTNPQGRASNTWGTIRGAFGDPVTATTSKALIVSGQLELVGGGGANAYTWMRYALTYEDSVTLKYRGTDTAAWYHSRADSITPLKHYGYEFDPISGSGTMSNTYNSWPEGNQGTAWLLNNGNWTSTNSNGGGPFSAVKNAPRNAVANAGIYNWGISVQPINDTINEVRWYLVEKTNKYWFGGTARAKATTTKFNGIAFGFNNDMQATQINLIAVKVDMGTAITVPEAPWQAFYVDQWGKTNLGKEGKILWQDTTGGKTGTIIGDAGLTNPQGRASNTWGTIRGAFGDPVTATTSKALIVSGQLELVGGGGANAYTWMRYALTYEDSVTLKYRGTDTAAWYHSRADSITPLKHYGYEFDPISGSATMSNTYNSWPEGNQGTAWLLNNGNWTSTNSNGGGPFSAVKNAPRNAVAIAGIYNWAISVQPINDTINEVRWYLIEKTNKYWFGGTARAKATTTKFNGIAFGFNNDMQATQINLMAVKVDMGTAITVPAAPWQNYYVADWGVFGNRFNGWKFMPDPDGLTGNAGIGGTAANTGWTAIRGGFDPFNLANGPGLVITGNLELVGGSFDAKNSLRIGVLNSTAAGKIVANTAKDSTRWDGAETGLGYLFIPQSGSNTQETWADTKVGNWGSVASGPWLQTDGTGDLMLGAIPQMPAKAVGGAGVYNFAFSVIPKSDGKNDVKFTLYKTGYTYVATASIAAPLVTTTFNSIAFALNTNASTTALKITNVLVDTTSKGITVGVDAPIGSSVPTVYALSQNYPNPFNPTTTIQYDLPMSSHVTLTIYDMLGRMVTKLVDQQQSASRYTVQFDASRLSSGVYFYRIDARSQNDSKTFTSVKKLLLMK